MQNLGGFFEKFKNKVTEQVQNLVFIIEIIQKHTGILFEMKDIDLSRGILRIKTTALQKNIIFIKREMILKDLNKKVHVEDIR